MTNTLATDDGGPTPAIYRHFVEADNEAKVEALTPDLLTDNAIDLGTGCNLTYGQIYNLSLFELRTFQAYIEANLATGFIRQSLSLGVVPSLFAKMKNRRLRLSVNCCALNKVTVKNWSPFPLFSEILHPVPDPRIFTKLDLRMAYNLIQINEVKVNKTPVRMRYGQFEEKVMPCGPTNSVATLQCYIDDSLQ